MKVTGDVGRTARLWICGGVVLLGAGGCASSAVVKTSASSPAVTASVGQVLTSSPPVASVDPNAPASSGDPTVITTGRCAGLEVTAASPTPSSFPRLDVVPGNQGNGVPLEAGDSIYLHATGPCLNELMIVPDGKLLHGPVPNTAVSVDANGDAALTSQPGAAGATGIRLFLGYPCGSLPGEVCNGDPPLLATINVDIIARSDPAPPTSSRTEPGPLAVVRVPGCQPTLAATMSVTPSPSSTTTTTTRFAPGSPVAGVLCQYNLGVPADISTGLLSRRLVLTAVTLHDVATDVQALTTSDEDASCPPPKIVEVVQLVYPNESTTSLIITCSMVWQGDAHAMLTEPLADEVQKLLAGAPSTPATSPSSLPTTTS